MVESKQWLEIKIPVNSAFEESISNYLFEIGSIGCYTSENILISYFDLFDWNEEKLERLKIYLSELGLRVDSANIKFNELADQDWNATWKQSLKPIVVFPDLIIKPTWCQLTPPENSVVIEIDPQMAFGTGEHATTQLMLKLMKNHLRSQQRVFDIGTGSGILAIAAAKMTKCTVVAVDIDPVAVLTAKNNIYINSVAKNVSLVTGTIDCIRNISFDAILANIDRKAILSLLPLIPKLLNPDGVLILSGILIIEEEIIQKELNKFHFSTLFNLTQDEWLGLVVRQRHQSVGIDMGRDQASIPNPERFRKAVLVAQPVYD